MDNLYEEVSGIEAFNRFFNGEYAQFLYNDNKWYSFEVICWSVDKLKSGQFRFRVKRPTLKINIEIPQPLTPEYSEEYWTFSDIHPSCVSKSRCGAKF